MHAKPQFCRTHGSLNKKGEITNVQEFTNHLYRLHLHL